MTAAPRAADLPAGSVVADAKRAYFKASDEGWSPWRGTNGSHYTNDHIDAAIPAGAVVLRVGDGTDTP